MNTYLIILSLIIIVAAVVTFVLRCKKLDEDKKYSVKTCLAHKDAVVVTSLVGLGLGLVGVVVGLLAKTKKRGRKRS